MLWNFTFITSCLKNQNVRLIIFFLLFISFSAAGQQLMTPTAFLGYSPGERFTPHHAVVDYFQHAAATHPERMQLKDYGITYGGRKLVYAAVSNPENMRRIEEIRMNNLRLAGRVSGQGNTDMPAIVWMSFNVHGNEASSSEVAMAFLHMMLSGSDARRDEWLKNTVVIIDPCLNPDGRDRYVNWYNQVVGRNADPSPQTREHYEPWPGGRTNYYYFDLNRDWAWQTQVESRQRMKVYHEWMPVVHVDFHEQFPNSPYYFAPAAEPFHDVITPFQRDFQSVIGKNHARYFDEQGWLYFTREYFDLFYPAYGDTYPLFNGAIGMTYEQAGHGRAGLAIETGGDTLTLKDRIAHHLTTALSTIEIAAQNHTKLNVEFKKYFEDAVQKGSGDFKTYVLDGSNPGKVQAITELFRMNEISFGYAGKKIRTKGYNYFTGKTEDYTTGEMDLVIPVQQPKAALVRVLFEPHSRLSDSLTYDITAWALPYAYGMKAVATTDKIPLNTQTNADAYTKPKPDAYAYLVQYSSFRDGRLMALLLKEGVRLRVSESGFVYQGKNFNAGTMVILRKGNENKIQRTLALADSLGVAITETASGFMDSGVDFGSDKVKPIKANRVGIVMGNRISEANAGAIWHFFDRELDYPLSVFQPDDLSRLSLSGLDVLILPHGYYENLGKKDELEALKNWVRGGGKIIAIGNAVAQMATGGWGIERKKDANDQQKAGSYDNIVRYADRERMSVADNIPGAIYRVELDNTHPLGFGYPDYYYSLKNSSHLYTFSKDAWNVGVIKKSGPTAGFVGSNVTDRIKDGAVIMVQPYGSGSIVYLADDPLFRGFWENGKLLFVNAVFLAGF